jgi:hypothetical protein
MYVAITDRELTEDLENGSLDDTGYQIGELHFDLSSLVLTF